MFMATGEFLIVKENEKVGSVGVRRTLNSVPDVIMVQIGSLLIPDIAVQLVSVSMYVTGK